MKKKVFPIGIVIILLILLAGGISLFQSVSVKDTYLYIDEDDTIDSVYTKLNHSVNGLQFSAFKSLSSLTKYKKRIRTGRYRLSDKNILQIFRCLRNGNQDPIRLTIPSVRTMDKLAGVLSEKLMIDSLSLIKAFEDSAFCAHWGYNPRTIACMFIPNTYELYWNISLNDLFKRMKAESATFWTKDRLHLAKMANFTPEEVITLASIVDEETANNSEKSNIAGMYINRLHIGMPLQADPTIKYAWKRFELRRIYHDLLLIKSPYNTYINKGLPPGPIRIPTIAGIDAVLNYAHHDYLYMCAKEDFSGTHNFARTYAEHLKNAAKYAKALNTHGIK